MFSMPRKPVSADQPPAAGPVSPWLDTAAAARYLGKEPGTLKGWRSKGEGPAFHVVSRQFIRYHVDDLDAFVRGGSRENSFGR
jgi:hypothetical protein